MSQRETDPSHRHAGAPPAAAERDPAPLARAVRGAGWGFEHAGGLDCALRRRDAVLTATNRASRLLIEADDPWTALPEALGEIGRASEMDRLLLLLELPIDGGARMGHVATGEWTAAGVPAHASLGLAEQANDNFPEFVAHLHAGRPCWLHREDVADAGRDHFLRLGIRTTAAYPIFVDGRYAGCLRFDDCRARREYRSHEAAALGAAAQVVGAALQRERLVDAIRREREQAAERRSALLGAVARASEALTRTPDLDAGLDEALGWLGEATGVDRVVFFRYDHAARAGFLRAEWGRAGIRPVRSVSAGPFTYEDFGEVWRPLLAGKSYQSPLHRKTGANAELNRATDTLTDLHVPVVVEGRFWGNLCFDDCTAERSWSEGEVEVLRAAAAALAAAVQRHEAERAHAEELAAERERAAVQRAVDAEELNRLLEGVVAASRALLDERDLEEGLRRWCGSLAGATGADRAGVGLFVDDAAHDLPQPVNYLDWARSGIDPLDGTMIPRTSDFRAWSRRLLAGEIVWASREDLEDSASRAYWDTTGCHANYIVPVVVDGRAWGWLYLDFESPREYRDADVAVLRTAAAGAAAAVRRDQAVRAGLEERRARERAERERATELARHNARLQTATEAAQVLIDTPGLDAACAEVLAMLGTALDVDRAALGLLSPDGEGFWCDLAHEWTAPGVPRQSDDPALRRTRLAGSPAEVESFRQGNPVQGVVDDLAEPQRTEQRATGARSQFALPVLVEGEAWGVLGFDDCTRARRWNTGEIAFLRVVAAAIASAVQRERTERAHREILAAEREQAALARAAELARANDALRTAITGLSRLDDLDGFLAEMLRTAISVTGAHGGTVDLLDEGGVTHAVLFDRHGIIPRERQEREGLRRTPMGPLIRRVADDILGSEDAWIVAPHDSVHTPQMRALHDREGSRAIRIIPMAVGDRLLGWMGLSFPDPDPPFGRSFALLRVLAEQMTMAVEMLRLAEEAREAAVAREREVAADERAETLHRHNQVLERRARLLGAVAEVSQRLIDAESPKAAFDEIVALLGMGSAVDRVCLMSFSPPDAHSARGWLKMETEWDGPGVIRQMDSGESTINLDDLGPLYDRWLAGEIVMPTDTLPEPFRSGQVALGVRTQIAVLIPLAPDEYWGFLGFDDCTDDREWDEGFVSVLHIAAALLGSSLQSHAAEERRRDAERNVLLERAHAARTRADELVRANDALRRGVERLAADRSVDSLVGAFLAESMAAVGARGGAVLLRDPETGRFNTVAMFDGHLLTADERAADPVIARYVEAASHDPARIVERLTRGESPILYVDALRDTYPQAYAFHTPRGDRTVWYAPLTLNGEVLGFTRLARRTDELPGEAAREMVEALAQQLVLALELTRLAAEAREAAVARERELAAERRAVELGRANTALSRAVLATAGSSDFEGVLGRSLASVTEAAGASYGTLFRYDAGANTLSAVFWVEDGVVHAGTDPGSPAILRAPFDADVTPAFRLYVGTRDVMASDLAAMDEEFRAAAWPGVIEWHLENGRHWACAIPVLVGSEPVGILGLAWTDPVSFSPDERELLLTLSSQVALVMQLADLASATRGAAVAREQGRAAQERAADLAKANEALRAGVDEMAGSATVSGILTAFLRQAVRATGADVGGALLRVGDTTQFDLAAVYADGTILDAGALGDHPLAREISTVSRADRQGHFAALARGEVRWCPVDSELAADLPLVAEFHEAEGRRMIWDVPFSVRGEVRGYLSVVFRDAERPPPVVVEAVTALATQVGLALELTRLAEEAREAAVAREREVAAEERAAELAHANAVLQRTVGRLSDVADVSAFYSVALAEMAGALSADSAGLMLFDTARRSFRMTCSVLNGAEQPLAHGPHAGEWTLDDPLIARAWEAIQRADPLLVADVDGPYVHPDTRAWHRSRGDTAALFLPLFRGANPLGFAAFGVRERDGATRLKGELARALGQQLALALELDRLGEQGRHAAVLEERTRLAREIHDTLAHGLAGIAVTLEGARGILPRDPAEGLAHVDRALGLARESLADARYALYALRPLGPDRMGLGLAMRQLVSRFNGQNGTAVRVDAPEAPLPLAEEAEVELLRIAQEAVSNAVRHARARTVRVTLSASEEGSVTLQVSDDGRGFEFGALEPAQKVGITGMRERAARLGGALAVLSTPGEGTDVAVVVPSRAERRAPERFT